MTFEVGDYIWIMTWRCLQKIEKITLSKVYFSETQWVDRDALYSWIKDGYAKVFKLKEVK